MNKHYLLTLSIEVALAQAGFDATQWTPPTLLGGEPVAVAVEGKDKQQ